MDAYGHVNHANTVTLLEEARVAMVFTEASRRGLTDMSRGMVVVKLSVHYRAPLVFDGGEVDVAISVRDIRVSSFVLDYVMTPGLPDSERSGSNREPRPSRSPDVLLTAETLMAPYVARSRPRRLTDAERDFLENWHGGDDRG